MVYAKHNIIWLLNILLALLIVLLWVGISFFYVMQDLVIEQPPLSPSKEKIPPSSFQLPKESYKAIGHPSLQLKMQLPQMRVPDLRNSLLFHGKNSRPDAGPLQELFFSLGNPQEVIGVKPHEPVYIQIKEGVTRTYAFSPGNKPTELWFQAQMEGNQAAIQVKLKDEQGRIQNEPLERAQFLLAEKAITSAPWNIDKWRVDASLLARQHARWNGRDLFLEEHGGQDYQQLQGKQRLTFGQGDELYAVYVDKGGILIWKEGKWQSAPLGQATEKEPLLRVNKLEDKLMSFELFDVEGKRKITLNMIKTPDPLPPNSMVDDFQFIGARTRIHFMFKVQKERMMVGPEDWFLFTPEGWKKLKAGREIDQYVESKLTGPLLIINKIENQNEAKWLSATLYSTGRSQSMEWEIPLQVGREAPPPAPENPVPNEAEPLNIPIPKG